MAKKARGADSKDFAAKQTMNPPAGEEQHPDPAEQVPNPPSPVSTPGPAGKVGQFTGRGAPGLQKK